MVTRALFVHHFLFIFSKLDCSLKANLISSFFWIDEFHLSSSYFWIGEFTNITRIGQGQYLKTIALSLGLVEEQLTVLSKTIHRCKKMARVSCKLCSIWKSVFSKWECCYTKKSDTSRQHNQRFGFSTWQRNKVAVNRDLNILTLKYYFM